EEGGSEELGGLKLNGEESLAQKALVRVFERILKVDEERSKMNKEEGENGEDNTGDGSGGIPQGPVVCRLLAASYQIGSVLGRGGKIIEKIRLESGAQVRVMPKDQIPECAFPGDELIQMAGKFFAVKKALLLVSNCLQEAGNSGSNRPMGMAAPHGYGGDHHHRMGMEEEVVFRMLCHSDKVGSLIGKGGSIRRALQTETGASIKIADPSPDSDDRVSLEQRHSPTQDAVMRVHSRIVEAGFESGAAIVARLLVHSRQIGCIWGKGGMIISELRRLTGASIHVFPREQVAKYGMPSDEVVQPGSNRHAGEISEFEGPTARNESVTVEMAIPQSLLAWVYGENNINLGHIKEVSGAKVAVTEGKAGIVLSGTYDETQTAQCLVHAFILCEQHLTPFGL
ncbi:hypothetical protein M8C21_004927, partial [Ambrosia artemisiifolia]